MADHAISCGTRLALRQAGVRTLNDLERMAMLHPNVARELPARVGPEGKVGPLAQRRLGAAMQGVLAANAARQTARMHQQCVTGRVCSQARR